MDPLADLRASFLARLPADLAALRASSAASPSQAAVYAVHRIASMAGVLGYADVDELALSMDDHAEETGGFAENDLSALIAALERLSRQSP